MHYPNEEKCHRFCAQRDDEDWLCYHHNITSEKQLEQMKEDISVIQSRLLESFDSIERQSKLKLYAMNLAAHRSDRNSIDYEPTTADDAVDFTDLLYEELELCCYEEIRDHLQKSLQHESRIQLLLDQVNYCEGVWG